MDLGSKLSRRWFICLAGTSIAGGMSGCIGGGGTSGVLEEKWSFEIGNKESAISLAVAGGSVYFPTSDKLYAVNTENGEKEWEWKSENSFANNDITVSGDSIYCVTEKDDVYRVMRFDTANREVKWSYEVGDRFSRGLRPVVSDDQVYFNDGKEVKCLDSSNGGEIWGFETGGEVRMPPSVKDGVAYAGSNDGKLYAVDGNGEKSWDFETGGGVWSTPAVSEGKVFFGSNDQVFYALNAETGEEEWSESGLDGSGPNSPIAGSKNVHFSLGGAKLYTLGKLAGTSKWSKESYSPLSVEDGTLYMTEGSDFEAVNTETGETKWRKKNFDVYGTYPVINDGIIYKQEFGSMSDSGEPKRYIKAYRHPEN